MATLLFSRRRYYSLLVGLLLVANGLFSVTPHIATATTDFSPTIALNSPVANNSSAAAATTSKTAKPNTTITLKEYQERRQRLMQLVGDDLVVILGNRDDGSLGVDAKFRQNNHFQYLTGVEIPGSALILVPKGYQGAKEWLFIPPRNEREELYTGRQPDANPATAKLLGVERIASTGDLNKMLFEILDSGDATKPKPKVYTIVPTGRRSPLINEAELVQEIRRKTPDTPVAALLPLMEELRVVKSPTEVALVQKAIDITIEAQQEVRRTIKPQMFEYQLEGTILGSFYREGAQRAGFPSIVGSGLNSTILHYNRNREQIQENDLVVIDIGAEYDYYTADVTRTYPATGHYTPRQKEIYRLVLQAQEAAMKAFKPGKSTMSDLNQVAINTMRQSPLRDKQGRTLDRAFIHGLGHFLGMDVHDIGNYGRPLPVGSIITIEPGIYLPDEKIGVRIEDDYLVTDKGLVKLTANLPSDPDEIERLMAEKK
jgi:Xaa-Pro aminopeptidase